MDKRQCYTMEQGYTSSDFSFYKKFSESMEVGRRECMGLQCDAGKEMWYQVDSYTHRGEWGSERVITLVNDKGVQIETSSFGWRRVTTEHELALREKQEYDVFITQIAAIKAPTSLRRWQSEVIEMFEHTYEDILYYGDEE